MRGRFVAGSIFNWQTLLSQCLLELLDLLARFVDAVRKRRRCIGRAKRGLLVEVVRQRAAMGVQKLQQLREFFLLGCVGGWLSEQSLKDLVSIFVFVLARHLSPTRDGLRTMLGWIERSQA